MNATLLLVIAIFGYILIIDQNVSDYFVLLLKLLRVNTQRLFWMIQFHPRNPITNFLKEREYAKLAKELEKELKS